MYGWHQNILFIDLDRKKFEYFHPEEKILKENIGGKGLAGYYLKDHIKKDCSDPSLPLIFATAPLIDTPSPTSGRMTIMSRSPLTGTICDSSVGGHLGKQIKRCGLDAIIITGRSNSLTGLIISEDKIEFCPCPQFAQTPTNEVFDALDSGYSAAVIGPSAENGVLFSNICIDRRFFAGRGGLGLIMANKNLKYLAVCGGKKTRIADKEALNRAKKEVFRLVSASPMISGEYGLKKVGTSAMYDLMHNRRMMPTANFARTYFPEAKNMNAYNIQRSYKTKRQGCSGCYILCKVNDENKKELPEFETLSHFSALLNNTSIESVVNANILCTELGMDTISTGATLSCFQEIHNKRLNSICDYIKKIAYRKDEGEILGKGAFRYASHFSRQDLAMCVKKLELPAYDPRGAYGMALAYATSTRGGCHLRAYPISHEILRKPVATDRFSFTGKARIIKYSEDLNAIIDSLTACKFLFFGVSIEEYSSIFNAVTGCDYNREKLMHIGEKIYFRERLMNIENGFDHKDDDLPQRFFKEAGSSGDGIEIPPINRKDFLDARSDYYKIRGLSETGMPINIS